MSNNQTNQPIQVAEIRAYINNHSSIDPARVRGLHGTYVFLRDRVTAKMLRRYVLDGADENAGTYPIEKAFEELKDIQLSRRGSFQVVWEFFTPEQVAAAAKAAKDDEEIQRVAAEVHRKELEAQQRAIADAQEKLHQLEQNGPVPVPTPGETPAEPPAEREAPKGLKALAAKVGAKAKKSEQPQKEAA